MGPEPTYKIVTMDGAVLNPQADLMGNFPIGTIRANPDLAASILEGRVQGLTFTLQDGTRITSQGDFVNAVMAGTPDNPTIITIVTQP